MFKYLKYVYGDNTYKDYIVFKEDDATLNVVIKDTLRIRKNIVKIEIWENCECYHDMPDYSLVSFNNVKRIYISDYGVHHVIVEKGVKNNVLKCIVKWPGYGEYPELMATWHE